MLWFYKFNDGTAIKHRVAYEKSLLTGKPVKVHAGSYYYKGYEVDYNEERCKDYQWGFQEVSEYPEDSEFCKTKKECLLCIDSIIKDFAGGNVI